MRHLRPAALMAVLAGCVAVAPAAAEPTPRTERVSVAADGTQADRETGGADLSGDGRFVVLRSMATNLVPGTPDIQHRVYVKELRTGRIELVSVASDGTRANGASWSSSISADGRYVVFDSEATNLAPGRTPAPTGTSSSATGRPARSSASASRTTAPRATAARPPPAPTWPGRRSSHQRRGQPRPRRHQRGVRRLRTPPGVTWDDLGMTLG
ncbi:hypothetical protein [Streptomyces griseocarneus]|uniref:Uncharacterized protein n=1 Tax=Streptomyces griseocarneus TaxID=51201 RepID=A0ABX7RV36_9ACTN|nr:hypothetical protein [Streptomyces griseocarneus]QSY51119.1 hypothetical protein J3S04_09595 [Streptomyces griseocarneus]